MNPRIRVQLHAARLALMTLVEDHPILVAKLRALPYPGTSEGWISEWRVCARLVGVLATSAGWAVVTLVALLDTVDEPIPATLPSAVLAAA